MVALGMGDSENQPPTKRECKMRFTKFTALFLAKYPDGECGQTQTGIYVRFTQDGKSYLYGNYGIAALAAKLEMSCKNVLRTYKKNQLKKSNDLPTLP